MIKNHLVYNPVTDWRFDLLKAENSFLWDTNKKRYIDFSSGWNTTNLGWNNAEVNEAVAKQAQKNTYAPMWTADEVQVEYANLLTSVFPKELDAVCRASGGTEANEMAMKIARAVTGRSKIISFAHTYHGQSFGTLSLGFIPEYTKQIAPVLPDIIQLDYPNVHSGKSESEILLNFLSQLENHLKTEQIAAVLTEAGIISGWGSMLEAPKGFLTGIRTLTKKYGTVLIVDEVGTGFSRTGTLFAIEREQIIPDIITLAKGISNGASAIAAVVTKSKLVENHIGAFKPTSTFGWTPVACAAALKTLQIHLRDKVWELAQKKGEIVQDYLQKSLKNNPNMRNLRGWGLEIAFDLQQENKTGEDNSDLSSIIVQNCFDKGLHIANAGDCIQIMPPLTIPDDVLEKGLNILVGVIQDIKS